MSKSNKNSSKKLAKRSTSKIERYGLVDHAVRLLKVTPRLTYKEIAEELNSIAGLSGDEAINATNVMNFAKSYPDLRKELLLENRNYMRKMVLEGVEFDMLNILKDLAARLTFMIDTMEEEALMVGALPDPKGYKALSSELRSTLKHIEEIHKEIYNMEVVKEFMIEVIKTLKEVCPNAMDEFIKRMKMKRDSQILANELLKGGI